MRFLLVVASFLLAGQKSFAQECPQWGDQPGALRYLQENKAHGTGADPVCVNRAFATLSHDKSNAEALVGLLDFERSVEQDDFKTEGGRYPARGYLLTIGKPAIPYLIAAIKNNDSELVRKNAAHTLGAMHSPCVRGVMALLDKEAGKPGSTTEQQARLRSARDYIGNFYPPCKAETSGGRNESRVSRKGQ